MNEPKPLRKSSGTAWCWQDKAVLRRIREAFDATNDVASALATYTALTEIASDRQREDFVTTHAWIARASGLSVRTVQARLAVLSEIGLVEVITPSLRAPSTYRLLSFGNGCATSGNGCVAFGNGQKQTTLPTLEESPEESPEESGKKRASRFTPPTIDEVKAYAGEIQLADTEADKFFDYYVSKGWQVGKTPMRDWKAALRNWQRRNDSPMKGADHATHQRNNSRNALTY